ncbi:LOW QUALITY PROTEIN: Krueppel homolog 2 [Diaphorina citri]|uniref:LOW QUALITY PROTEIN: Krueppel homolog 2 n=1 Tax=Diaphorina citri TaxID=121845 RepID=A0A1S4EDG0_DIACI|nr:LOW QUALITY PROTEIN: Krueppel homolog 2 [Diaphorina citri]
MKSTVLGIDDSAFCNPVNSYYKVLIANAAISALRLNQRIPPFTFSAAFFTQLMSSHSNPVNSYYKVLIANAAISALRLNQRIPPFTFSAAFFTQLMTEDSFHYLWFSLIFLYVQPVTLALLPVFLFCLIHFSSYSYSLTLLDTLGQNSWWGARLLISLVEFQSNSILRLIAFAEIFLMPSVVMMILFGKAGLFTPFMYYTFLKMRYASRRNPHTRQILNFDCYLSGKAGLFTPFMYYTFLKMRYASRRNPHTRNMFLEIRQGVEKLAANPRCPEVNCNI